MNINKVFIYGNLTRDPESRQSSSGTSIANLSIATNRKYNDSNGQLQEEVEYHRVVFFGKLADLATQYLKKGGGVFVEGRLKTSKYDDANGVTKYSTDIIGDSMQFGPRPGAGGGAAPAAAGSAPAQAPAAPTINPDDIPF